MSTLLQFELWRIYRKPRSWIPFVAIAILVGIVHAVMALQGQELTALALQSLQQHLDIQGRYLHGYLVAFIVQGLLLVHLPFLVTLVAGDLIAGEAAHGTLQLLFLQPNARWKIVVAKCGALAVYVGSVVAFLALIALGFGVVLFGTGDLIVLKTNAVVIIRKDEVLWRFLATYCFNWLGLLVPAYLALLLGCFAENALGPVIGAMAVVIVLTAVALLEVPLVEDVSNWFFTTHAAAWRMFFDDPILVEGLIRSVIVLSVHCIVFCFVTAVVMERKDVLS